MPAQALRKSPLASPRISGAQGEWSLASISMVPLARPSHSSSRFERPRMGGRHLSRVSPSGTSSAAKTR
eukprot:6828611-Prymnesium_polylepis.1